MNTVTLRINTYTQSAQIFINGSEPSPYSELSNYSFGQFLHDPAEILNALARELNDDFTLEVCANTFLFQIYHAASTAYELCAGCISVPAALNFASAERAAQLGAALLAQEHTAFIVCGGNSIPENIPNTLSYGNVSVKIATAEPESPFTKIDLSQISITPELVASACETFIVDPVIGAAAAGSQVPEIAVCARMEPILSAIIPTHMDVGSQADIQVCAYPESCSIPSVVAQTSNPDVTSVNGLTLSAVSAGTAPIQVFVSGENEPFASQTLTVQKHIYVSSIKIVGITELLREGTSLQISAKVLPADAEDASAVIWSSSDSQIAEYLDGQLILKKAGSCIISAKTEHALASAEIIVVPKLQSLNLSQHSITTNVGRKVPINVSLTPENAYNSSYSWKSSDKSVAIVEKDEDGRKLVKAVGIGSCTLTCTASDGNISDQCAVTVESIMYKKKKKSPLHVIVCIVAIALICFVCFKACGSSLAGEPSDIEVPGQSTEAPSTEPPFAGQTPEQHTESPSPEQTRPTETHSSEPSPSAEPTPNVDPQSVRAEDITSPDQIVTLLEEAYAQTQKYEAESSDIIISAPSVVAAYYVCTKDPSVPYHDYFTGLTFSNAIAVVTHYTYEDEGFRGSTYDRIFVWMFPDLFFDDEGNIAYTGNAPCRFNGLGVDLENIPEWFQIEFLGAVEATELSL